MVPAKRRDGHMYWMENARKYLGVREIPGPKHNTIITGWLSRLHAWWTDDETPWCGVFVGAVLQEAGLPIPKHYYRALAWLDHGKRLDKPAVGCVVVFARSGGGHVGFVVGKDQRGRLMVLGGNQGNKVSVAPFDRSRVKGYTWPGTDSLPLSYSLPVVDSNGQLSSKDEQ